MCSFDLQSVNVNCQHPRTFCRRRENRVSFKLSHFLQRPLSKLLKVSDLSFFVCQGLLDVRGDDFKTNNP